MEARNIKSQGDLALFIARNCDRIPVRAKVDGKWGSHFLVDLDTKEALITLARFVSENKVPMRMKKRDAKRLRKQEVKK